MLIYDFEVFKHDWLVVFKDTTSLSYTSIVNDLNELKQFYSNNKHRIHIGFNNKRYDNLVYRAMLDGADPYDVTQMIIAQDDVMGVYQRWDLNKSHFPSADMSQDLGEVGMSLKEYEGWKGLNIDESDVPFDIQRKLTNQEIMDTINYCKSDVDATHELLKDKIDVVKTKINIIHEFKLTRADLILTNAQLVSKVLGAKRVPRHDEFQPFDTTLLKLKHVLDIKGIMYRKTERVKPMTVREFYSQTYDYECKLIVQMFDMEITFAFGGIHGALVKFKYEGEMWLDDVTSYYPSMMVEYDFLSRNTAKGSKELFKRLLHDRVAVKFTDPDKADAYKLLINIAFGASNAEFNNMYDPHQANNICIAGQLMLMDLALRLEPYTKIVQINTDGVAHIPIDKDMCDKIAKEWEQDTRMSLGRDVFKAVYQKDVNNYIMVEENGNLTVKGSYVRQTNVNGHKARTMRVNNRIVDNAVVNYFVNGVSPELTVHRSQDKMDFQIIKKTGSTYDGTVYEIFGRDKPCNKINRVYATTNRSWGRLYKVRHLEGTRDLVPSLPQHCWLANKDEFDLRDLDRQYYIDEAWKRIRDYV